MKCTTTRKIPVEDIEKLLKAIRPYMARLSGSFSVSPDAYYIWATVTFSNLDDMLAFDNDWRKVMVDKTNSRSDNPVLDDFLTSLESAMK